VRWLPSREKLLQAYGAEGEEDDRILVKGRRREGMEKVAAGLREGKQ